MAHKTTPLKAEDFSPAEQKRFARLMAAAMRDGECIKLHPVANGYAHFGTSRRIYRAHRVAYAVFNGPIPEGLFVCHSCDVRNCVNPAHLWLGTALDNSQDASRKGRMRGTKKGRTRKPTKYGPELIAQIKSGELPAREAMRQHGISSAHFYRIKSNTQRKRG